LLSCYAFAREREMNGSLTAGSRSLMKLPRISL
jgi:hypothetical protein